MNIGLLAIAMTVGQPGAPIAPPAVAMPSPFLFVKVSVPAGGKVVWQPGSNAAASADGPVGLRPGYPYRLEIANLTGLKGVSLFPSLEVRGSLVLRPGLDVTKHPIPIVLTDRDIDRVMEGRLLTKIYFLEDPVHAAAVDATPNEPLELTATTEEEAYKEARARGRMMLVLRLGERAMNKDELAREHIDGTVMLPGTKTMAMPSVPPCFPFAGVQIYDPILGPKPATEECLHDGGDTGAKLGVGDNGKLIGLDPSDTAMQFKTSRGGNKVVASNRVGLCVPRFVAAKVETSIAGHHVVRSPEAGLAIRPVSAVATKMGHGESSRLNQIAGSIGSTRPSGIETKAGPSVIDSWQGKMAGLSSVKGTAVAAEIRSPEEITSFPGGGSLILQKRVEGADPKQGPVLGEEVTFFLRFSNPTPEVMTEVAISDSLTTRLEYIDGTAKCSRPATFTISNNSAGSVVLKWTIDGKLMPGEKGVISFKAKIR